MDDGSHTPGLDRALLRAEQEAQERHRQVIERVGEIARAAAAECFKTCPHVRAIDNNSRWIGKVESEGGKRMDRLEKAVENIRVFNAESVGEIKGAAKAAAKSQQRLSFVVMALLALGTLLVQWLKT